MMRRTSALLVAFVVASAASGCDKFEAPPTGVSATPAKGTNDGRARGRAALTATMRAARALTATCVAADLRWEADPSDTNIPRHFSRPCIPERCTPSPADIDKMRSRVEEARKLVDGDAAMQAPSTQGFVALSEAMVGFIGTELPGTTSSAAASDPTGARISGLSMHYTAMATAFHGLYPDEPDVPLEPPSLVASLAVALPGGDVCKGWAIARYCDVSAVRVPKERRWRAVPACIEVESVKK